MDGFRLVKVRITVSSSPALRPIALSAFARSTIPLNRSKAGVAGNGAAMAAFGNRFGVLRAVTITWADNGCPAGYAPATKLVRRPLVGRSRVGVPGRPMPRRLYGVTNGAVSGPGAWSLKATQL